MKQQQEFGPKELQSQEQIRFLISQVLIAAVVVSIAAAIGLAILFNRSTTQRLLVLLRNTERLGARKELLPALGGSDEVAKIDQVFHEMAGSLAAAERYKQELLAIVSHDLRTPLTSISASLTLLGHESMGPLPERALNLVTVAERSATRLISLINDLLDFEKLEAGKLQLVRKNILVEELFERVDETLSDLASKSEISIEYLPTDLQVAVDGERIIQVLTNLVANALKFSPSNSTINMSAQKLDGCVEFKVADQGRGIPESEVGKIFERFHQVKKEDAQIGHGSGLGLSICQKFVEAHGGTIGVTSVEGKGSTFWFRIPIAD
jgi:signal transduction histidine kinase